MKRVISDYHMFILQLNPYHKNYAETYKLQLAILLHLHVQ